jgi:hypothetical protein
VRVSARLMAQAKRRQIGVGGAVHNLEPGVLEGEILQNRLSPADRVSLEAALAALEHKSLAMRLAGLIGKPVELVLRAHKGFASEAVFRLTEMALKAALRVALSSALPSLRDASGRRHRMLAALSGAAGGSLGISSLAFELPVSTAILLHGIADIARLEGEDLTTDEGRLACLEVLALSGGEREGERGLGYLAARTAIARATTEAASYMAERGLVDESAPLLLRAITLVAKRFGVSISQKLAAQAVPVIGAVAGAAINTAFMEHFQSMARGHFAVRRLERNHGRDFIESACREIRLARTGAAWSARRSSQWTKSEA